MALGVTIMQVEAVSLFKHVGSDRKYVISSLVRGDTVRFKHVDDTLGTCDVVFIVKGLHTPSQHSLLRCLGTVQPQVMKEFNDGFGYQFTLTDKQLNFVVPIKQTNWTFWKRFFERYHLRWQFDDGEIQRVSLYAEYGFLNRREEFEELIYFSDVTVTRSLKERLLGYGDIVILGQDRSTATMQLDNIVNAKAVAAELNDVIQQLKTDAVRRHEFITI